MTESSATQTTAASSVVPPYVPYRTFRNFIDGLKQAIPSRIDRSVMPSMSGALQSQLTATLRSLGLITTTSHPTDLLPRLVNSEGPERTKILSLILLAAYPYIFKKDFDIKTATPRTLQEQFFKAGVSGGTVDKCVNFFLAAVKDAGIEVSPYLKNMRGSRIGGRVRQRIQRETAQVGTNGTEQQATGDGSLMTWSQLLLSKFPSFDPSWPDEVKAKWFDGFHRLMRQGPDGKEP